LFLKKTLIQELIDFQDFPGPVLIFQDFPVLENARIKFQDFPGFPGPVRTLLKLALEVYNQKQWFLGLVSHGQSYLTDY